MIKSKLAFKFIAPILINLAILAIVIALLIGDITKKLMVDRVKSLNADFIQLQARRHIISDTDFSSYNPTRTEQVFSTLFEEIRTRDIVKIKVWDQGSKIIYSDDRRLIGKQYPDNKELQKAMQGQPIANIAQPLKPENVYEKSFGQLMELYVPIFLSDKNRPAGVVEVYFKLDTLNQSIKDAQLKIISFIFMVFVLLAFFLLILLSLVILQPIKKFNKAITQVKNGNFDIQIHTDSNDELGELARAFNQMSQKLDELQKVKNEFVFLAAHELKNPLSVIKAHISFMLRKQYSILPKEVVYHLKSVNQSNDQLIRLVEDILEVAKSRSGQLSIELVPVEMHEIIEKVLAELKDVADRRKIIIKYDHQKLPKVLADDIRLKEVVYNLIFNSIKYSKEGSVTIIYHTVESKYVTTHIQDSGYGIPLNKQPKIFKKFFRTQKAEAKHIQGTGLGLFITKQLIEKMRGRIWFISQVGRGSTFSFRLSRVTKA